MWKVSSKLPAKKNEYTCGNNGIEILLGKPLKVTDEPIVKIISNQLDIKLGQFMQEELDFVQRKINIRKAAEIWKTTSQ